MTNLSHSASFHSVKWIAPSNPGIKLLVNNAGLLAGSGAFLASRAADCISSFQVNLLGVMLFCQTVIPHVQQVGGGAIINVGSTGRLGTEPGFGAYTTMKHRLIGLTKTIAD